MSLSEFFHQLNSSGQCASLKLSCTNVHKNLSSIEGSFDHRVVGNLGFFAKLIGKGGVVELNDKDTNRDCFLASDILNTLREFKLSDFLFMVPSREDACFTQIGVISIDGFRSDGHHFGVVQNDTSVVERSLMEARASNFSDDAIGDSRSDEISDDIPRMEDGVVLKEVVFTAVA